MRFTKVKTPPSTKMLEYSSIFDRIECKNFTLINLYSPSIRKDFSLFDREKVKYIIDLNYSVVESIDEKEKIVKMKLTPKNYYFNKEFSEAFEGCVGIVDIDDKNNNDLTILVSTFTTLSYLILISLKGGSVNKIIPKKYKWDKIETHSYSVQNKNFALYTNRKILCEDGIESASSLFGGDESEGRNSPKSEKGGNSPEKDTPLPTKKNVERKSPSPQPEREDTPIEREDGNYSPEDFKKSLLHIPSPTVLPPKNTEIFSKEWYSSLKKYIEEILILYFDILPQKLSRKKLLPLLLSQNFLENQWTKFLVCPVYNPDPSKNYDQLEAIGDAILKYCFKNYVLRKIPLVEDKELSELLARYMSVEFQPILGRHLLFQDWVIVDELTTSIPNKIVEDVLESFCGALASVCEELTLSPGLGVNLIQTFITKVWDGSGLSLSLTMGTNKTLIDQLETRYGFDQGSGKPLFTSEGDLKKVVYHIKGKNFKEWMKDILLLSGKTESEILALNLPTSIRSEKYGKSQKAAESAAADDIIAQLEKFGIKKELLTTKDIRLSAMYRNPEFKKTIDKVISKINGLNEEFHPVRIYIERPKENQTPDTSNLYLIGVDKNDKIKKYFSESFKPKGFGKEDDIKLLIDYLNK